MEPTASSTECTPSDDFDPQAQVVDAWGIRYPSFKAFLRGESDQDDPCTRSVELLKGQGRSAAFCRAFRQGYEGTPEVHVSQPLATYEPQASKDGWEWADKQGLVTDGTAAWRSLSVRNIRIGHGFDAARRAVGEGHSG